MSRSIRSPEALDGGTLVDCRPAAIDPTDRVRDLDQLSADDRRAFLAAVDGSAHSPEMDGLDSGDVVRFTKYYRVR
ncbi:hypothetical protein [Halobellus ordinarius]|uniref:hypothetical protein n=1 Tax=Halobellus ordinarius TaxID=3075120 RepID=UPI0028801F4E|nr:hypothetical protein [Halobellus sp. ZY16]